MATQINSVDLGPIWLQSGNGVPDHLGIKGTVFVDLDSANQYINKDGLVYWDRFLTTTSGGTDTFVTGMTFNNGNYNLSIIRNDGISFTQNLSILATDMTVTGGTYNINTGIVTFTNNSGGTFNVTGFTSGMTDSYTTGATLSGNSIQFNNNLQGPNFYSVDLFPLLSAKTDNTTFNLHTGNTNNPHQTSFNNLISTAHTHSISDIIGLTTSLDSKFDKSGGTITGGLTAITISATTYQNLPLDIRVTGGTYSSGTTIFTNNTGGTFNVTGFISADTFTTGFTYSNNNLTIKQNENKPDLNVLINTVTGLTVNGTLSGTTLLGNSIIGSTISATTYQNLPLDIRVTGGTFDNNTDTITFTNNSGGTFNVTGLTDNFVTGFTYSNNNLTIKQNGGLSDLSVLINTMTGLTVNGTLSATSLVSNTISATTYQNLPLDIRVTGGTFNNATDTITFTNNSGGTFNVSGLTDNFTTGTTRINDTVFFNRNDSLSAYTSDVSLSAINNRLLINDSSTGVISFDGLSFSASGTTFNVGAVKAWFIDNETNPFTPTKAYSEFSSTTGNTLLNLTGQNVTYVAINSGGTIMQQSTPFTSTQQRNVIPLGVIVHSNRIFINAVNNQPVVNLSPLSQLSDLIESVGFFNISGNKFSENGSNLNINKSSGKLFKQGVNFINDNKNPHILTLAALTAPSNIRYRLSNSFEYGNTSVVDPNNYDLSGVLTSVPDTKFTVQRIYLFQSNLVRIQYGQKYYDSLDDAISRIIFDPFTVEPNLLENGLLRGFLVISKGVTTLTDTTKFKFIEASRFGSPIETNTGSGLFRGEILNSSSSGLINGGKITTATTTTFNVSAGSGRIVDNTTNPNTPVLTNVSWSAFSGVTLTNLTGQSGTAIFINSNGAIIQQNINTLPNDADIRDKIYLGGIGHPVSFIASIFNNPITLINPISQLNDLTSSIGPFSISGNRIVKITGSLRLLKTTGKSYFSNGNYQTDNTNPSVFTVSSLSGLTLSYVKQNAFLGGVSANISTSQYDLNGTLTAMPSNDFVAHRIWHQPSNNILFFQYGQATYASLNACRSGFESENFIVPQPLEFGAYLVAIILVREGETNLDNPARAEIIQQGKFAGSGSGGGGTVDTLQTAYNNATQGEVIIDATRGPVSIVNGAGADTVKAIEIKNATNNVTSFILGNGSLSASTVSAATTYVGSMSALSLNTTSRVTALTGSTNIYTIPVSAYTGAFFDYTINDGTNLRGGNIMSIWNPSTVQFTDNSTSDIGNTSGLTFNMTISGSNVILRTSATTSNWDVKTIIRVI